MTQNPYPPSDLVHENTHDRHYAADILVIGGSIAAVSYTHLTLPTILLV